MILQALNRFTGSSKTIGEILWSSRVDGLFLKHHHQSIVKNHAWYRVMNSIEKVMSPSFSHDVSIIYPWFAHHLPMIYPWCVQYFPMIPSFTHDLPIIYPWFAHENNPFLAVTSCQLRMLRSEGVLPSVSAAVPPRVASLQLATEVLVQLRQGAEQIGGAAKPWGALLMCHGGGNLWENCRENGKLVRKCWEDGQIMGKSWDWLKMVE